MEVGLIFPELTIPTREAEFFQQMVSNLSLKKGEYFVAPDAHCDQIAFIDSGLLASVKVKGRQKIILSRYHQNQFASVFRSFLTEERSVWGIQALEPTNLTVISSHLFHQLCHRHFCWTQFWLKVFGTQTTVLTERERRLMHP